MKVAMQHWEDHNESTPVLLCNTHNTKETGKVGRRKENAGAMIVVKRSSSLTNEWLSPTLSQISCVSYEEYHK